MTTSRGSGINAEILSTGAAVATSRGLGINAEILSSGEAPAKSRGSGINLEVLYRVPPGELRATHMGVFLAESQKPSEARAGTLHTQVMETQEPSVPHVTHEYLQVQETLQASDARVTHLYVLVARQEGIPPLPEPETPYRDCDLILDVFNDDQETIRWSASTNPDIPVPFLMLPARYAEQEIDVAQGGATLTSITVSVIDKAQTPGRQETGYMTARLAYLAIADIDGRRARLRRARSLPTGSGFQLEVVIDGVAGTPELGEDYSRYDFQIRDVREIERKVRLFDGSVSGTNSLLPNAPILPYGLNEETGEYLLPAAIPLTGTFLQNSGEFPNGSTGTVDLTGNPEAQRTIRLSTHALLAGTVSEEGPEIFPPFGGTLWERVRFPSLAIWWRPAGSGDEWTVIDGNHLILDVTFAYRRYNLAVVTTDLGDNLVRIEEIAFGDDRIGPAGLDPDPYDPPDPTSALPFHGQSIELLVVTGGPASKENPYHLEGLTAGQFAKNVYDGVYSARDPLTGAIVPTGIRYDEAALLALTTPIRGRILEPVDDARDYLEKYIYAPLGYSPALDIFGRVSPVSQVPPADISDLPIVNDAVTEPAPDWNAGARKYNTVRFTYPRDYIPHEDVDPETGDGLSDRDVIVETFDPASLQRHRSVKIALELDGRLFRAVGTTPLGEPALEAGQGAELGNILAQDRALYMLPRYSFGAAAIRVNVLRRAHPELRVGAWVIVDLSWFPDYVSGERRLVAIGQVMAIGDLDCVWRRLLIEILLLELES